MKTLTARPRVKTASASRKVSPLIEQFEARQLMATNLCSPTAGLGFLAGSVTADTASQTALPAITVQLYTAGSNSPIATQKTDANGQYLFTGLKPGDYVLKEVVPAGYTATGAVANSQLNPASVSNTSTINVTVVDPSKIVVNYGGVIPGSSAVFNDVVVGKAGVNAAGPFADTLGTTAGATDLNAGYQTFCVNDQQNLSYTGGESYSVIAKPISDLTANGCKVSADTAGRIAYLFNHYGANDLTDVQGAGLQAAIWELLYDGGNANFNSGSFQITGPAGPTDQATLDQVTAQATAYIKESLGKHEQAVFLDAAAANPCQIDGLQSVLATGSYNFALTKTTNTCPTTPCSPTPPVVCTPPTINWGCNTGGIWSWLNGLKSTRCDAKPAPCTPTSSSWNWSFSCTPVVQPKLSCLTAWSSSIGCGTSWGSVKGFCW